MDLFAKRRRDRARELELSDAEVARRAGLAEGRYGHYVRETQEPDFETLLRICAALDVTPNALLLLSEEPRPDEHERLLSRLTARKLETGNLKLGVQQVRKPHGGVDNQPP